MSEIKTFLNNKEKELPSYPEVLEVDDIIALDLLVNEQPMSPAEKRHYILGAHWGAKIEELRKGDFFNTQEIKAIEKLVNEENLSPAEKRHYILNNEFQKKIEYLKNTQQKELLVNDVKKIKSRNVPSIKEVKKGDQLLMSFEEKGVKDHYWCTVKHVETMFKESNSPLLTISINEDNKLDKDKIVDFGRDNKCRSYLVDYCTTRYNNLDIGEKSYNKRVLEVKPADTKKIKPKKISRVK
jgi:hypothetical protein